MREEKNNSSHPADEHLETQNGNQLTNPADHPVSEVSWEETITQIINHHIGAIIF